MTDRTISPLRRRMAGDMTIRGFTVGTQRGYLVAVENFTSFLGRAPDGATAEDLSLVKTSSGVQILGFSFERCCRTRTRQIGRRLVNEVLTRDTWLAATLR